MASTGDKVVSTQIIDHVDGQPSIVLSNGNWGVFDPKTNMYKDTGIKASPEDDSSAVKYYKLGNVTTPPEAPSQTGGWSTLASLNASLAQAEWEEDPLQTSSTNRFCWIATYGKENIVDTVATEAEGHLVFKPKFTRTNVRLWSNYANSPTISVVGNEIIITNPDGTVIKQKFASTEAINDLTTLINSLQSQVDGAIYSYSMEGVPTLNTLPTTDWRLDSSGSPITNPATIADIYKTHVGDTYTDLLTYRSYRFSQTGSSGADPSHYEWKIIEDDALSAALGEIAQLGREKITVFTVEPNKPYKKGDMWLDGEVMLHAIQTSDVFNLAHWVQPYATKVELDAIETALQSAAADATLAKNNLASLESNLTNMTGTVADAIKDNIISDTELMDLKSELKQLDIDQETLLTTVNYLLDSTYLPTAPKATLQTRSNNSIAVGGSMDIYQAQISTMITDRVITAQERADYLSKFNTYKTDLKLLNEAIFGASSAIEGELKRLADEKVNGLEVGGRNLILNSNVKKQSGLYLISNYDLSADLIDGQKYTVTVYADLPEGRYPTIAGTPSAVIYHNLIKKDVGVYTGTFTYNTNPTYPNNLTNKIAVYNSPNNAMFGGYISKIKLEKGTILTDWTLAPEDVQAEIDMGVATVTTLYKNANEGVVVPKPTEANEVSGGWKETSPAKVDGQVIWSVNRVTLKNGTKVYSNPANIQGADGEGGINVIVTRQGSFRTYWRQIGDQGQILTTPEKVSEIIGGVEIGGVKYVQCKVIIYKGSVDVTASALADPTTLPKWYLNNVLMGSVTDTLNIPINHADGVDDEVRFEYTDTNAKNWKGATV